MPKLLRQRWQKVRSQCPWQPHHGCHTVVVFSMDAPTQCRARNRSRYQHHIEGFAILVGRLRILDHVHREALQLEPLLKQRVCVERLSSSRTHHEQCSIPSLRIHSCLRSWHVDRGWVARASIAGCLLKEIARLGPHTSEQQNTNHSSHRHVARSEQTKNRDRRLWPPEEWQLG